MMELLKYEFVRNATIAGILANITCCIIGVYAMVQKIIFIGGRTWLSYCLM
ncbi:ABC 3 transport family protein [Methanococcoides vulcani]|uniref:ABC 3 transport family protein n=1 Tax=Methanococcoides vulcani TaxID=1353158 RepID=A0A1H9YDX0_9EURY|nr:ABC 3 transport family protein [Methanococcoides vulcani]